MFLRAEDDVPLNGGRPELLPAERAGRVGGRTRNSILTHGQADRHVIAAVAVTGTYLPVSLILPFTDLLSFFFFLLLLLQLLLWLQPGQSSVSQLTWPRHSRGCRAVYMKYPVYKAYYYEQMNLRFFGLSSPHFTLQWKKKKQK